MRDTVEETKAGTVDVRYGGAGGSNATKAAVRDNEGDNSNAERTEVAPRSDPGPPTPAVVRR